MSQAAERAEGIYQANRNVKTNKQWSSTPTRKLSMSPPVSSQSLPSNQTYSSKAQAGEKWDSSRLFSEKKRGRKGWDPSKENRFLPQDMNMTVTIDNDLPSNVSRYQHRQTTPQMHWNQTHYHQEYQPQPAA